MVVAPRTVRPGAVYRCVVSLLHLDHPVDVRASLTRSGQEIAFTDSVVTKGYPETLLLQVRVDGDEESNNFYVRKTCSLQSCFVVELFKMRCL